jgi:hypothetical protein
VVCVLGGGALLNQQRKLARSQINTLPPQTLQPPIYLHTCAARRYAFVYPGSIS